MKLLPGHRSPIGCTTIDDSDNDAKALVCARAVLRSAGRHRSTAEAVSRLLACSERRGIGRAANLFGHGVPGRIGTGEGKSLSNNKNKYIDINNVNVWEPLLCALKGHFDSLVLWGCDVGAGAQGANLLSRLATVVNMPVEAPTNWLLCRRRSQFAIQNDDGWQMALPHEGPPKAVNAWKVTTGGSQIEVFNVDDALSVSSYTIPFTLNGQFVRVLTADIQSVEVHDLDVGQESTFMLTEKQIGSLPHVLDFNEWVSPGGPILAARTGYMILKYTYFGVSGQAQFDLYNNRLLHDATTPEDYTCYRTVRKVIARLKTP